MAKVLYITANPKSVEESYSLTVGQAFIEAYKQASPDDEVITIDLYQTDIPYIDAEVFNGWGKLQQGKAFDELNENEKAKVSSINQLTEQFMQAEKYVFVTPMWNFASPAKLKAYIDCIVIAGKTFKYTDTGAVGLLENKKAIHIQARGGKYSEGPAKDLEFGDKYLKTVLTFLGVTCEESIIIEGMAQFPEQAEAIKEQIVAQAINAAKQFANNVVTV